MVLTHGFVLDEKGRKMSKSLGNVTAPQDVIKQSGADILRMWVCASDYADDLRIGPEILKTTVDTYRKLRNTMRWMLGSLAHFHEEERVKLEKMPELERLMLHRLSELDALVRKAYADFDYKRIFAALSSFMTVDLSAFYFDIRKDTLYCDPISSATRKACAHRDRSSVPLHGDLAGADAVLHGGRGLGLALSAPTRKSVHLETFPEVPAAWRDDGLAEKWRKIRTVRRVVTGALEIERAQKRIGSSLEAHPIVHVSNGNLFEAVVDVDLAEVCITSAATLVNDEGPADAFRLPDVPASRSCPIWPKAPNARARGKSSPASAPIRNIRMFRRATPRRCANGKPCARRRSRSRGAHTASYCGPLTRFGLAVAAIAACSIRPASFICCSSSISPPRARSGSAPFFDFVLTRNTGISYGLFQRKAPLGQWVLLGSRGWRWRCSGSGWRGPSTG